MSLTSRRFELTSLVLLAFAASGCHSTDKTIEPLYADGAIFVSVTDVAGHDRGGLGRVTYLSRAKHTLRSDIEAFTGVQPVPVHVVVEKDDLDLVSFDLLSDSREHGVKPLLSVGRDELSSWIGVAPKGVTLGVVVDGGVVSAHVFAVRGQPPVIATPVTAASGPLASDLLESGDVNSALQTLRLAASATDDYHRALADLVAKTPQLDAAHLELALRAVYFTEASRLEIASYVDRQSNDPLAARSRESEADLRARARSTYELAVRLAPYTNALLDKELARVSDLDFANGMRLLGFLSTAFNAEVGAAAFQGLISTVKLTGAQKLALAKLAREKGNFTVVQSLVLEWFRSDAGYSVASLGQALGDLIAAGAMRDALLLQAAAECPTLTGSDLKALGELMAAGDSYSQLLKKSAGLVSTLTAAELVGLMGAQNSWSALVIDVYYSKVSDLSALNLAVIAAHLGGDARQAFVMKALAGFQSLSTAEFVALASLLDDAARDETVLAWLPKVSDRAEAAHLAQLFGLLTPASRATHLMSFIDALPSLTTEALVALAQAAPERTGFILLAYLDRLTDFTPANAVKIAQYLRERDKDSVLLLVMERAKTVTADDLAAVGAAAYERAAYLLKENLAKVSPLTAAGIVTISRVINDYSRDEFIVSAVERLVSLTTDELLTVSQQSYNRAQYLLSHELERISDLTVENTVKLAGRVSAPDQDQVVKFWFSKNAKLTTQELIRLAGASYYNGSATIIAQSDKVSDLTVANAIVLAQRLNYGDRDTFLLKAVTIVTDLSSANLLTLAGNAYGNRDAVIQRGVDRLANH